MGVPALAVQKQESSGDVSLSTGTGALVHTPVVSYIGKRAAEADPALVYGGLPVAHGGYKAEAGNNGDLMGAVHEVPGLVPAPALNVQKNSNGGALTVGTSAFVTHSLVKRDADADAALLYGAYGYGYHGLGYARYGYAGYGYPYGGYAYYG